MTASAICGLAQNAGQLIFFRALQALGGSMIAANGRAIVSVNLPPEERGRAHDLLELRSHLAARFALAAHVPASQPVRIGTPKPLGPAYS